MTSLLLHVIDEEMRVDDPYSWKTLRMVEREQRRGTEPAIYPQNEITSSNSHTQIPSPPSETIIESSGFEFFMGLPDEVRCMILNYLFGDEMENAALASYSVRKALKMKYPRHEVLNKMWSGDNGKNPSGIETSNPLESVNNDGDGISRIEAPNPLELLLVFLSHPRTASNLKMYPRVLQIEGCDEREHFDDPLLRQQNSDDTCCLATSLHRLVKVAVRPLPRLSSQEKFEWGEQIRSSRQGPALALLVSILSGIQSLVLFDSMSVVQDLDPCSSRVADAYERLSYVETGSTHSGYYENFSVLAQFIVVQSMRSFRGLRLSDTKFTSLPTKRKLHQEEKFRKVDKLISWPTNLNTCHTKPTITNLKLDSCAIRTGSLHRILSSIQSLSEFSYTCHWPEGTRQFKYSEWGGRGHWEPPKIVDILLQTAMTTLVSLDLTNIGEYCAQRGADYSMGSLRDFYKLRYIRVEYAMFVQDAPHDRWSSRVRSLLSVMPESLHYLSLAGPIFSANDASAVLDFLAPKIKWKVMEEVEERDEDAVSGIDEEVEEEHTEEEESRKKRKKHAKQKSKKKAGEKEISLQNLAKRLHGSEKKVRSRETIDGRKEKGKSGKEKKKGKEARRKKRELEEGEEQKRKREEKAETDALMMEERGFIPVLTSWQLGVPHLKEIIFENFDGEETLKKLLAPFRKGAAKRKIRLCEARLVHRPPLRADDGDRMDGDVADEEDVRYEHEPMLVDVVNNLGGHSYHAWTEVWKSSDPDMPIAMVTELFPGSLPIVSSEASKKASNASTSTNPPSIYPSLSPMPRVLLRSPSEKSTRPNNTTASAPASVTDLTHLIQSSAHITTADSSAPDTDSAPHVSSAPQIDPPRHLLARTYNWKVTAGGYPTSPAPSNRPSMGPSPAQAAPSTAQSSSMQLDVPMAPSSRTPESNTPLSMRTEGAMDFSRPSSSSALSSPPPPSPLDAQEDFKNPVEEFIADEDKCDGMLSADEASDIDDGDEEDAEE